MYSFFCQVPSKFALEKHKDTKKMNKAKNKIYSRIPGCPEKFPEFPENFPVPGKIPGKKIPGFIPGKKFPEKFPDSDIYTIN